MTLKAEEGTQRIIRALESLVYEHGLPNSFTCGELNQNSTRNPSAMIIGKWRWLVVRALKDRGWDIKYDNGRFIVLDAPEPKKK